MRDLKPAVRVRLDENNFRDLVAGKTVEVYGHGVSIHGEVPVLIILADIGFAVMVDAIREATK